MAERTGKCTNYTKCTTAYRNQPIPVTDSMICPECGQPLQEIAEKRSAPRLPIPMIAAGVVGLLLVIGTFAWCAKRPPATTASNAATAESAQTAPPAPPQPEPAPAPATPPTPTTTEPAIASTQPPPSDLPPATVPTTVPPGTPTTAEPPATEPAGPVAVETRINVDPKSAANQEIKQEVLKRIDAMPKLTDVEKDKLYSHVERARGMGRVITIPFGSAQTALSAQNIAELKAATESPQVKEMVSDPSVVFVILGFADKQGQLAANQRISTIRADNVMEALRDKCGLLNVMHAVGMGGSELFDSGDRARNRVAEVWAVLP